MLLAAASTANIVGTNPEILPSYDGQWVGVMSPNLQMK